MHLGILMLAWLLAVNTLLHEFVKKVKHILVAAGWLSSQLSGVMLVGIEAAVEFWLALSWSPQAQWLRYSDPSGCLLVSV